jgi:hypothetical protein
VAHRDLRAIACRYPERESQSFGIPVGPDRANWFIEGGFEWASRLGKYGECFRSIPQKCETDDVFLDRTEAGEGVLCQITS